MIERLWKNYNLSLTLAGMFLASWIGQFFFQWLEFVEEQHDHGKTAETSSAVLP